MIFFVFSFFCFEKKDRIISKKNFIEKPDMSLKNDKYNLFNKLKLERKTSKNNRSLFFITEHILLRNSYNNLVSNKTANVIYKTHIFDSLSIFWIFRSFWSTKKIKNCIDFGTGGGFPGFLVAIFFSEIFVSLLDSIERKTKFHFGVLEILNLQNCNSICIRGERIYQSIVHRTKYDIVTSRAVSELEDLLKMFYFMAKNGGKFIAMKRIKCCGKEIENTYTYFSEPNFKIKCLIKVDKRNDGKVLKIYKKL